MSDVEVDGIAMPHGCYSSALIASMRLACAGVYPSCIGVLLIALWLELSALSAKRLALDTLCCTITGADVTVLMIIPNDNLFELTDVVRARWYPYLK